jgi:hypothetical protein
VRGTERRTARPPEPVDSNPDRHGSSFVDYSPR